MQIDDAEYDAEGAECDNPEESVHKPVHVINPVVLVFFGQKETHIVNFELIHLYSSGTSLRLLSLDLLFFFAYCLIVVERVLVLCEVLSVLHTSELLLEEDLVDLVLFLLDRLVAFVDDKLLAHVLDLLQFPQFCVEVEGFGRLFVHPLLRLLVAFA
jgi:hypothetical protein